MQKKKKKKNAKKKKMLNGDNCEFQGGHSTIEIIS